MDISCAQVPHNVLCSNVSVLVAHNVLCSNASVLVTQLTRKSGS